MVFFELFSLFFGLVVLVRSSDVFVESAVRLAKFLGISSFVIGLTVVAVGTSVPELATSVSAALKDSSGIILGTVVGSNISNIGLIMAIAILVGGAVKVERKIFEKDVFLLLVVSVLFFYFLLDSVISFTEGLILLFSFAAYFFFLFAVEFKFKEFFEFKNFMKSFYGVSSFLLNLSFYREILKQGFDPKTYSAMIKDNPEIFEKKSPPKGSKEEKEAVVEYEKSLVSGLARNMLLLFFSGLGVWIGSEFTVSGAISTAQIFGIAPEIISFTIIAVGTSLPELSVSFSSVKKGFHEIFLGNIIGSNISNILLVAGISALITTLNVSFSLIMLPLLIMLLLSVLVLFFVYGSWKIGRKSAFVLLLVYIVFLYLVFSGHAVLP